LTAPDRLPDPEVWAHLDDCLANYRDEHEDLLLQPESFEERSLHNAMDGLQDFALRLLRTGLVPPDLSDRLSNYQPGSPIENKILDLLQYDLVQHRIEFDLADEVVSRLKGLNKRVVLTIVALALLLRSQPSDTAIKYFQRATTLFLTGYDTEVSIMCGAVIEAALATRISDEHLRESGFKPSYRRTGVFSLGQRMQFEESHPFLNEALRNELWQVVNWRNDAVHVQPDLGPQPGLPLLFAGHLLGAILPRDVVA
jgi:hypothetical protein